jgi:hypothetical protein
MTECSPPLALGFHPNRPVQILFDAPTTSSDGGLLLLRQVDDRLGLSRGFAACLPDDRDPSRVEHDRLEQVRQRVYQIAMGYEDCNDADTLRRDSMLKTVCSRLPEEPRGLSSQPSLSRFENAVVRGATLNRLLESLERSYVDALPADTTVVVLDIDSTADETHGQQQLTFFHGHYDHHMYHPLLIFDGDGQLVTALLRPGNAHAARSAWSMLRRVIRRLKARFPSVQVVVRGDSGFCTPHLLNKLERLNAELGDIDYIIGLAKNAVLTRLAEDPLAEAKARFEQTARHVRFFAAVAYAAKSWPCERHVVVKAEHDAKGANPRFIVTTLTEFPPQLMYDVGYCGRGQCENRIKDFKNALNADRLSCGRFVANFFRLLLHAAAYRLMYVLRSAAAAVGSELGHVQFDTLRLRLLKVAANVTQRVRRILIQLPAVFPFAGLFRQISALLAAPEWDTS